VHRDRTNNLQAVFFRAVFEYDILRADDTRVLLLVIVSVSARRVISLVLAYKVFFSVNN